MNEIRQFIHDIEFRPDIEWNLKELEGFTKLRQFVGNQDKKPESDKEDQMKPQSIFSELVYAIDGWDNKRIYLERDEWCKTILEECHKHKPTDVLNCKMKNLSIALYKLKTKWEV